jgi:hypothetical protein
MVGIYPTGTYIPGGYIPPLGGEKQGNGKLMISMGYDSFPFPFSDWEKGKFDQRLLLINSKRYFPFLEKYGNKWK